MRCTAISWPSATGPSSATASTAISCQLDRLGRGPAGGFGAREQQQVGDQAPHPLGGAQRRVGRLALLTVQRFGEDFEVRQDARERRAQLVRGVGDEAPLARERGLAFAACRVELVEHRLQRARKFGDLVFGRRSRQRVDGSRVRAISAAAPVRLAIGAIARRAIAIPASSASAVPPSTPSTRKSSIRPTVAFSESVRRPYCR